MQVPEGAPLAQRPNRGRSPFSLWQNKTNRTCGFDGNRPTATCRVGQGERRAKTLRKLRQGEANESEIKVSESKVKKRNQSMIGVALAVMLAITAPATAQTPQPGKPITIVVPFPPGPALDLVARLSGAKLAEALGQAVVVENRTGANGTLGANAVARAAPDGQMLLFTTALQRGSVTSATAVMFAVETIVPAGIGLAFLGDATRPGFAGVAAVGFALTIAGTLALATDAPGHG